MTDRFDRITIGGQTMDLRSALRYISRLGSAPWVTDLGSTLQELMGTDGAITVHTSGTTGPPKPIQFQREELVSSAELTGGHFTLREGDRALLCLPTRYIAGKMMVVRALVLGLDLEIVPLDGDPVRSVTGNAPRFAAMVPLQLERALNNDRATLGARFDKIILGGGPVPGRLAERMADLNIAIWHTYGMTETCTHVAARPLTSLAGLAGDDMPFKAIGHVMFAQDDRGCLIAHTPHLLTPRHVTHDVVELHDERHFTWRGRYDNVVLSGGLKLYPEEIEGRCSKLIDRPFYFTSEPDDQLGEILIGVIEGAFMGRDELNELEADLRQVLGQYEMPRRWKFVERMERNEGGKVVRKF